MRRPTYDWVALLQDLVHSDQGLERLDFIRKDRLHPKARPERDGGVIIPRIDDAFCPQQCEQLEEMQNGENALRTCFCLGAVSSGFVAFLMLTTSSASALSLSTGLVG